MLAFLISSTIMKSRKFEVVSNGVFLLGIIVLFLTLPLMKTKLDFQVNWRFFMISGTSTSCARAPTQNWSHAAIKSAIMTTADVLNLEGKPIADHTMIPANIFATGAGHVNKSKANDPGPVYAG